MRQHFLLYPSYFTFAELEAQWLPLNLYPRQRTERNERRDALLSLFARKTSFARALLFIVT